MKINTEWIKYYALHEYQYNKPTLSQAYVEAVFAYVRREGYEIVKKDATEDQGEAKNGPRQLEFRLKY